MQPMYCTSQVSIFQWPSLLGLVQPVSAGLWEMSAAAARTLMQGNKGWSVCPYLWAVQPIQAVIRDSIARTSHKSQAFMVWLLSFCLRLWWLLISPQPPHSRTPTPPAALRRALNRLHFTNGKLSSRPGSGVYKYVKYTFNYFKWVWQLINKEGRDKHTFDTGHCKATGKR